MTDTVRLLGTTVSADGFRTVHLYDAEGDRLSTLCGRTIHVRPMYVQHYSVSADRSDCPKCRALTAERRLTA